MKTDFENIAVAAPIETVDVDALLERSGFLPFHPLNERMIVKRIPHKDTAGSLWIPEKTRSLHQSGGDYIFLGVVVRVGPGSFPTTEREPDRPSDYVVLSEERMPMAVKVGDRILYENNRLNEVTLAGEQFVILHEQCVLAVLEGE